MAQHPPRGLHSAPLHRHAWGHAGSRGHRFRTAVQSTRRGNLTLVGSRGVTQVADRHGVIVNKTWRKSDSRSRIRIKHNVTWQLTCQQQQCHRVSAGKSSMLVLWLLSQRHYTAMNNRQHHVCRPTFPSITHSRPFTSEHARHVNQSHVTATHVVTRDRHTHSL